MQLPPYYRLKFVWDPEGVPAPEPSKTPAKRKAVSHTPRSQNCGLA